jgi:hypothetical protein
MQYIVIITILLRIYQATTADGTGISAGYRIPVGTGTDRFLIQVHRCGLKLNIPVRTCDVCACVLGSWVHNYKKNGTCTGRPTGISRSAYRTGTVQEPSNLDQGSYRYGIAFDWANTIGSGSYQPKLILVPTFLAVPV